VRRFDAATDVFQFAGHQPGLLRVLPGLPAQLADRPVIFSVGPDPEPEHTIGNPDATGRMVHADPRRPELANLPEMERWMSFLTS